MIVGVTLTGGELEGSGESTGPEQIAGINTATLGTLLGLVSGICYSFYLYFSRKAGTTAPRKDLYIQAMMYTAITQLVAPVLWGMHRLPAWWFRLHPRCPGRRRAAYR